MSDMSELSPAERAMQGCRLAERLHRGDVFAQACPSREVLRNVTSRWGVLVLVALRGGTHRFSELRRKIGGISEKMLAQTLQALEHDGFVRRVVHPVIPPHVDYSLTPAGQQVSERVEALADWIELSLPQILESRAAAAGAENEAPGRARATP